MGLRDLVSFLTTLPAGRGSLEGAARSFPLAPLVGALTGLLSGIAGAAGAALWGACAGGVLYTVAYILLTGGLHLDGYADVEDVLGSGLRGEEALQVLKDPRRGAHALVMVSAGLLASAALAGALAATGGPPALVLGGVTAHASAAASMVVLARRAPPPPYQGLSNLFHEAARGRGALRALAASLAAPAALALLAAVLADGQQAVALASASLAALLGAPAGVWLAIRGPVEALGFANGDVLGYSYEASRLAGLLASLAAATLARLAGA